MNPDDGMKRLFDADEWNLVLKQRTLPERARRMPLLIPAATVLAVAAIGAIVGLVFASGVRTPQLLPAEPEPTATISATPDATPAPTPSVEPPFAADWVEAESCYSVIGDRYDALEGEGQTMSDGYARNMAEQPGQHFYDVIVEGGLVCAMADRDCCDITLAYSWGPVSDAAAEKLTDELDRGNFTRSREGDLVIYRWEQGGLTGGYAIGDGHWATAVDNGGGDVLDDLIANAPWPSRQQSDLYLTSEGLGDLRMGEPIPESSDLVRWVDDYCGKAGGAWIATGPFENEFLVFTENREKHGDLIGITTWSNTIATKSGIRVGMSLDTLDSTFSDFDAIVDDLHYVIEGTNGEVSFDATAGLSAPTGFIFSIRVVEIGAPLPGTESTDAAGNCPA